MNVLKFQILKKLQILFVKREIKIRSYELSFYTKIEKTQITMNEKKVDAKIIVRNKIGIFY